MNNADTILNLMVKLNTQSQLTDKFCERED